jgi:hypothetical protein
MQGKQCKLQVEITLIMVAEHHRGFATCCMEEGGGGLAKSMHCPWEWAKLSDTGQGHLPGR